MRYNVKLRNDYAEWVLLRHEVTRSFRAEISFGGLGLKTTRKVNYERFSGSINPANEPRQLNCHLTRFSARSHSLVYAVQSPTICYNALESWWAQPTLRRRVARVPERHSKNSAELVGIRRMPRCAAEGIRRKMRRT